MLQDKKTVFDDDKNSGINMDLVTIENEQFYKISNVDKMRPFFMSIVSDSNHWLFISSNGGLSAGRKNAESSLFPYYTDDKITELADITGSKSIFQIYFNNACYLWEPFSDRYNEKYSITRNLYKSIYGNKIVFEEIINDFNIFFTYQWSSSDKFGFVKKCQIHNFSDNNYEIILLDGIQNIMPYGVSSDLQNSTSNLVDAYKRNELLPQSGVAIYALSAIIVDKAEPSEALKANVAWSFGLDNPLYLLSSLQLKTFRKKLPLTQEVDVKGEKGAYFLSSKINLQKNASKNWSIIANINQTQAQIIALENEILNNKNIERNVFEDIKNGTQNLIALTANADGLQYTADIRKDTRHFSNVLFNIMRGGIFDHNYQIEKQDFIEYIKKANNELFVKEVNFFNALPDIFTYEFLLQSISNEQNQDLTRLGTEYLPLKFSRRHGDPSRPWNKFSINTKNEIDGSKILDYQGNWRDIFQNWETLAHSYPQFIDGMIFKFLNASTFDGYNPYRVTKSGFDWETIEPDNPWSYIGYWGDHQIIYLLKFLELKEKIQPGSLQEFFEKEIFVYAAVPYVIKSYEEILSNPKDTIVFDHKWDLLINNRKEQFGADGALLRDGNDEIYYINFIEKILATVLAKMSNFIPEAGIWLNTQRPEWNDANNALVGNGVSMVTLYYLRRFLKFFQELVNNTTIETIKISNEMVEFYHTVRECLLEYKPLLNNAISDEDRKKILDTLGKAASDYRAQIYKTGFWGNKRTHSMQGLRNFVQISLDFIEHSIAANERKDNLYHSYNLMSVNGNKVLISYLPEMLEGQVAVLSSGMLSAEKSLQLLNSLRNSELYREDQNSYILYPNKQLPKFLEKNNISSNKVEKSILLQQLVKENNYQIINKDIKGNYHFNGNFHNANDLQNTLNQLATRREYSDAVAKEYDYILQLFEEVFNHKAFTGRSGTFYAYEGLGSIYWHMVSKLHLAVLEIINNALSNKVPREIIDKIKEHFYQIGEGIGVHKSPEVYGAFPTDPYSHTPYHKGAQQPGMTGQVKEDVLTRMGELGVNYNNGKIYFSPYLLNKNEFLDQQHNINLINVEGNINPVTVNKQELAFTICQVPVVYKLHSENKIIIKFKNGDSKTLQTLELSTEYSQKIFNRTNEIAVLEIYFNESVLN